MQLLILVGLIVGGILTENVAFYYLAAGVFTLTVVLPILLVVVGGIIAAVVGSRPYKPRPRRRR
ncbi:MAG TPA: hypothetical protein VGW38_09255 [Chloroflexota bacterium]|nr:hypothetical protein [Chloroflexota bacterium]